MIRLIGYEWKKLIKRKMVWVSLILALLLCMFTVCSPLIGFYYVKGEPAGNMYKEIMKDKAYLESVYRDGAQKASYVAEKTLRKVYKKVGFVAK